jgi:dihydrofolate reductase
MKTIAIMISTQNGGIGMNDRLPWMPLNILADSYKELATDQVVLVGKGSFSSYAHLRGEYTYVYTKDEGFPESDNVKHISGDPIDVIEKIKENHPNKNIIIAGGEHVFKQFYDLIDEWRITIIEEFAIYNKDINLTNIQYVWKKRRLINSGQDNNMNFSTYHYSKPEETHE